MKRTLIIAEAGVNHDGSLARALELVDAAAAAGADVVKFQTFHAEQLVTAHAKQARYQTANTGLDEPQLAMLRRLELSDEGYAKLAEHARQREIAFLSTPFDVDSLRLLVGLGVFAVKIPSGEITNPFLLEAAALTGLPILLSTGMSTLAEIEAALQVLADAGGGRDSIAGKVTLLHCTTEYPAPLGDVNLAAMGTMARTFGLPVGYSDHTEGIAVPTAAVALGATVIEKHFTLDRGLPGPDHRASLEPPELAAMVQSIRAVEAALGSEQKQPAPSERANALVARRSLVAAVRIRRGERFSADNLAAKRPGGGVSPMRARECIGRMATRDYEIDDLIEE